MIQKKILFSVVLFNVSLSFLACAMDQGDSTVPQLKLRSSSANSPRSLGIGSSPRRGSLESPRSSQLKTLTRSGSASKVEVAVLAKATLERVASSDKIAQLKKRNSVPALISPPSTAAGARQVVNEDTLLLGLSERAELRSSKSPRENGEAELVHGDSERTELLFQKLADCDLENDAEVTVSYFEAPESIEDYAK